MNIHVFWSYWWLIFPIMWMVSSVIRMILRDDYQRRRLQILKSYADQGKELPEALRREFYR